MTAFELLQVFEDTQNIIKTTSSFNTQMITSQKESQLFLEGYIAPDRTMRGDGKIDVVKNTTFQCARELFSQFRKIAVLNFANPHEPGGGVRRGAMAQEECLCRCSTLYPVLAQPYFLKHFYQYHYQNCDYFFSDRLIYSPLVTVIKSDDSVPKLLESPFFVDVITCAAPYLSGGENKTNKELMEIYKSRIINILEVAMSKGVDCLILGAFGCGAFHNDPKLMAKAFADVLIRKRYAGFFAKVVFAIKGSDDTDPNLEAFREALCNISIKDRLRIFR